MYFWAQFYKIWTESPFWTTWRAEKDATKQKLLSVQDVRQKGKMVIKIKITPLSLSRLQNVPFKKGFKKDKD